MQCYSRRQIVKHMGLAAGCLLLSPLSGCSTNDRPIDSADNTASDKEQFDWLEATGTYTPSDAFKQKGLWFTFGNDYADGRESVAKDTSITAIFEFYGDGTVTCWNVYDETGSSVIRFRDLEGLSDKEVLSMAKEHWPISQDEFESKKQNVIDELSSSYEDLKAEAADNPDLNVENAYFSRFLKTLNLCRCQRNQRVNPIRLRFKQTTQATTRNMRKYACRHVDILGCLALAGEVPQHGAERSSGIHSLEPMTILSTNPYLTRTSAATSIERLISSKATPAMMYTAQLIKDLAE